MLAHGAPGEVYNAGGPDEQANIDVVQRIVELTGASESQIEHVTDRPGHDRRYSLSSEKVRALGWAPRVRFEDGLAETVAWYRENAWWWEPIRSGELPRLLRTPVRPRAQLTPRSSTFPSSLTSVSVGDRFLAGVDALHARAGAIACDLDHSTVVSKVSISFSCPSIACLQPPVALSRRATFAPARSSPQIFFASSADRVALQVRHRLRDLLRFAFEGARRACWRTP